MQFPIRHFSCLAALLALSACAEPGGTFDPPDPYEAENRQAHAFNRGLDSYALRPASVGYVTILPEPMRMAVANFSSNFSTPGDIINDVLQGNFNDAGHNLLRFVVNTTIGLGGIFDTASAGGIEARGSDFGETLAVWGVQEGAYLEVPFLGPKTERHLVGDAVDFALNPLNYLFGAEYTLIVLGAGTATVLDNRFVLGDTLDEILYNSADSYALLQSLYLQNRRFELSESGVAGGDAGFDVYEDLYGDIFFEE